MLMILVVFPFGKAQFSQVTKSAFKKQQSPLMLPVWLCPSHCSWSPVPVESCVTANAGDAPSPRGPVALSSSDAEV